MIQEKNANWSEFRTKLQARKEELKREIDAAENRIENGSNALDGEMIDTKDAARKQNNLELHRTETRRDKNELAEVVLALSRLDEGVCGEGIDCGCDIDVRLLQGRPQSVQCLKCEEKFEATARR